MLIDSKIGGRELGRSSLGAAAPSLPHNSAPVVQIPKHLLLSSKAAQTVEKSPEAVMFL